MINNFITIKKPDPIRNYISNGASKKSLCYLIIVLVVALLVFAGLWYYLSIKSVPESSMDEETFKQLQIEKMIKKQMEEINALMGKMPPLSEKEIQVQAEELNKAMPKGALTEEEIQKQLEELNKIK